MTDLGERVDATEGVLRNWCERNHRKIAPDGSVSEQVAGELCGFAGGDALCRRVDEGRPVPRFYTLGGRRRYRVHDCAAFLENLYENGENDRL